MVRVAKIRFGEKIIEQVGVCAGEGKLGKLS